MVVLTCTLSCTRRRASPSSDSREQLARMNQFMHGICSAAGAHIQREHDSIATEQQQYEDKLLYIKYDLISRSTTHASGKAILIEAYRTRLQGMNEADTFYYLYIEPDTGFDVDTYFYDHPLENFSLGFMTDPVHFYAQFHYQRDVMYSSQQAPKVTFEIDDGKIMIDFAVSHGLRYTRTLSGEIASTTEIYRLSIDSKHLAVSLLVDTSTTGVDLCFLTKTPVQLWRTQLCLTDMGRRDYYKTNWIRTCSIKSATFNRNVLDKQLLGGCNALMLRLRQGSYTQEILQALAAYADFSVFNTVLIQETKNDLSQPAPFIPDESRRSNDDINWMLAAIHSIGYRIRYQLQDEKIGQRFIGMVRSLAGRSNDDRKHLHNALSKTYDVLSSDAEKFLHIDRVLEHFLQGPRELDELVMTRMRFVKRLVITPSRIIFQAPSLMHDNRILREFNANSAVSCSFQNDDMSGFAAVANSYDFVNEAVGDHLRTGVMVAGRHYEFLGCSGSQLRQNGCWFYARDPEGKTAEDIRDWMGDLQHIRNPGTYLSRMGQCFSDTTAAELDWDIEIEWHDEDIEGGADPAGKPYCFSDGVGRISEECLKLVFMKLTDEKIPSAFQVRLGGSKGMLTLDKKLDGKIIMVRNSMFKFQSAHATVEVMRRTQPTPLFLNHQIITLLSQLRGGIPDHVFIRFLNNMLHRLADILLDDDKALFALSSGGFPCCYSKLYKAGFKFTTDPFFKEMLKAVTCARINNVKQKTRIEIPHEYGRAMLGVMDEEDVLEYGEVFVQYSADIRKPKENPFVREGDIVVSKMPCLHPGDVRKFKAVNKPELHHLVDCIVFPRKGPRPHPNEMAGSDLDGDEYFVTWHPDLIFGGQNEPPMDFPSIKKNQQDRPITLEDMVQFIVNYIVNDKVGVISNAHLAWADYHQQGIHSPKCKELARIFCHVIDFNKTGYLPEEVKGKNLNSLLPDEYPDFMGKSDKDSYLSSRVLGKLYRISQIVEQSITTIDKEDTDRIRRGANWAMDERLVIEGHEDFIPSAEKLYNIYAEYLDAEQRRYGIESEEELVSGSVIKINGIAGRSDEVFDISKRLRERMKEVRQFIVKKFDELLEEQRTQEVSKRRQEMLLAAACYVVTYRNKRKHRSFPWVFGDHLLRILQQSQRPKPEGPLAMLSKSIEAIEMNLVDRTFRHHALDKPDDDDLARVYCVLINWGEKSKFLPGERSRSDVLSVAQFAEILDHIIENDEDVIRVLDGDTGPLLTAIFIGITNLNDDLRLNGRFVQRKAVINMKKQILLAHHQVARDPNAECLLVRKRANIQRTLKINKELWAKVSGMKSQLQSQLKARFNVDTKFRRQRRGGSMWIRGKEDDVMDCSQFWLESVQANHARLTGGLEEIFAQFGLQ